MNSRINKLVRSLLQKDSLEQCSLPELQQFAEKHPYFGAAQLLLTKKMQTDRHAGYDDQLQKTLLFFHNPIWVESILNDTGKAEIIKAKKESPAEEISTESGNGSPAAENAALSFAGVPAAEVLPAETGKTGTTSFDVPPPIEENIEILPVEEPAADSEMINEETPDNPEPVLENIPATAMSDPLPTATFPETNGAISTDPGNPEEKVPPVQDEVPLDIPPPRIEPLTAEKDELVFEPYHTVDYFASQGIKFKEEEKPTDKFGKQLKSFTEWLKTLKKVPATELVKSPEPVLEKKVEEMAEISITDREVLTEAMAEVWEKQGNRSKAIDIYSKLSLLEPAKSTYFAAKIEDLKKQN